MPIVLISLVFFITPLAFSQGAIQPLIVDRTLDTTNLAPHFRTLWDPSQTLSLADVQTRLEDFAPANRRDGASHPLGNGTAWVYFEVENPGLQAVDLIISNVVYLAQTTSLYLPREDGNYRELRQDFQNRFYGHVSFSRVAHFQWQVPPGRSKVFMKQTTYSLNRIKLNASSPESFQDRETIQNSTNFTLFGIIFCLILVRFGEYIISRNPAHLLFCFNGSAALGGSLLLSQLWRYLPVPNHIPHFAVLISCILVTLPWAIAPMEFVIGYLKISTPRYSILFVVRLAMYIFAGFTSLLTLFNYKFGLPLMIFLVALGHVVGMSLSLWKIQSSDAAKYLFGGWCISNFSLLIGLLVTVNIIPYSLLLLTTIMWGKPLEQFFFFLGLSVAAREENLGYGNDIKELNRMLKTQISTLRSIGSGVAHEVNNPLAIVQGNLEIIRNFSLEDHNNHPIARWVEGSQRALERIARIVSKLLRFSRETNAGPKTNLSLEHVLNEVLDACQDEMEALQVQLERPQFPAKTINIFACKDELKEVFTNVLQNAIDAVREVDERRIAVVLDHDTPGEIGILICDNGCGISDQIRDKMFDVMTSTRFTGSSSGFGLFFARQNIEINNGYIKEDRDYPSEYNTCMRIVLPISKKPQL